jgi:hypothetical protein
MVRLDRQRGKLAPTRLRRRRPGGYDDLIEIVVTATVA